MSRYSSHDPYLDTVSGILKNRFGSIAAIIHDNLKCAGAP
jgi:hypothetical protein